MVGPAVLVVGTGRSGTSTVARLLHEHFGICMGHYFKPPDHANLKGFYEDYLIHGLLLEAVQGGLHPQILLQTASKMHENCTVWGIKHHWLSELSTRFLAELDPKLVIRTWRPLGKTIKSWVQKEVRRGKSVSDINEDAFAKICLHREANMDKILKHFPTLTIRFDRRISDQELISDMGEYLEWCLGEAK